MREFKFRGKRTDNGEWVYGDLVVKAGMPFIFSFDATEPILVIPETIGQYTECKDKNGVEIYEGDTIKYQDRDYSEVFGQGYVYYDGDDCMFKIRCNNVILFFIHLLLEVVGNIHDKDEEYEQRIKSNQ